MLPRPVEQEDDMDKDVKLLLESVESLFMSRNPAVCVCFVPKQGINYLR